MPALKYDHRLKIINLCNRYDYLSQGYYVSLLAEARGLRCTPAVDDIVNLGWKRHYQGQLPELNALLQKTFREPPTEPLTRAYTLYFGRTEVPSLEPLARSIFDHFRFPLIRLKISYGAQGTWMIENIEPLALTDIPPEKFNFFQSCLNAFTGSAWRTKNQKQEKYWIAILHDPREPQPPSNKKAIKKFEKAAKKLNVFTELITRNDMASLLEYDALFIRETTAINHHTYRFALKAESEGIPCIDDTQSIIRCCNKVFQHELLKAKKIPQPATLILDKRNSKAIELPFDYPAVVKIPDGAFSKGVIKVTGPEALQEACAELFKKSEIILAQEFVASDFDWRIGLLNGAPLFACKYYMAVGHWQIYNHKAKTLKRKQGAHETLDIKEVPQDVLNTAVKAAKAVGPGLYGVDLKETNGQIVVMEVNDNPNIDAGIEDQIGGDMIYLEIIKRLIEMIETS